VKLRTSRFAFAALVGAALTVFVAAAALAAPAWNVEKKIKMKDLPPAVRQAVMEQSKGATLRGLSMELDKGKTYYEAQLTVNGHNRDIEFDANGRVVEIEEAIKIEDVPASAQAALLTIAGTGKVERVESLTRNGQIVGYEAVVVRAPVAGRAGQRLPGKTEVQVDTQGNLAHFD
jgi:hypothetical protein